MSMLVGGRPGWGSAVLRLSLIAGALFVLAAVPENLQTWDDSNASVLPSERTMPMWGNYVVAALMLVSIVALVAGWFVRRHGERGPAWARWASAAAIGGQLAWAAVLIASVVVSILPSEGVSGAVVPPWTWDAIFAIIALETVGTLLRDLRAYRSAPQSADAAVAAA